LKKLESENQSLTLGLGQLEETAKNREEQIMKMTDELKYLQTRLSKAEETAFTHQQTIVRLNQKIHE